MDELPSGEIPWPADVTLADVHRVSGTIICGYACKALDALFFVWQTK
jgi:hypothetical protein